MKRACSLLRTSAHYAADNFACGLHANGFTLTMSVDDLGPGDVLLTWNRHSSYNDYANQAARQGAAVLVAENGYFGREWQGDIWFALALDHHNGAGLWPRDDGRRWRAIGFELEPWREGGNEIVILPQRGIGEPGVAMPAGWAEQIQAEFGGRIRPHPGRNADDTLCADLERARCVMTWGSGAAVKAIAWGIPCYHGLYNWIGRRASWPIGLSVGILPEPFHGERSSMFADIACAMYREREIEDGSAIARLLTLHDEQKDIERAFSE